MIGWQKLTLPILNLVRTPQYGHQNRLTILSLFLNHPEFYCEWLRVVHKETSIQTKRDLTSQFWMPTSFPPVIIRSSILTHTSN